MFPKVSIQIPTYNQELTICRAIESCICQDYQNLEIIVCDDASTDGTFSAAKTYESGVVKVFRNEANLGRVGNYKRLFNELVNGEWVVNLDGDDYYKNPKFITNAIDAILRYQRKGHEIVFYQSAIEVVTPEETFKSIPKIPDDICLINGTDYFINFFSLNARSHLTTIYNHFNASRVKFYEWDTLFSDLNSIAKLSLLGEVILDKRICGVWNIHSANESKKLEKYVEREIKSRTHVAEFAQPYIGTREAEKWKKKAIDEIYHNLLYKNLKSDILTRGDWLRLFRYFKNEPYYYKTALKYLILFLIPKRRHIEKVV
ncbi:glycosyltransferase family 2 protein [Niabella pedocola]|uniref:Glycosyltransferase family 2 protein n=1 Tax=Niabella pedocola TaxID=1752077 RepID=A0ABS8PVU8_9BACT|nr:glycosyltransferase family 2 protein [Niabella pedocola]MCD2425189.1 glycosyltransferase family 2 protein [Niabella pedocola]